MSRELLQWRQGDVIPIAYLQQHLPLSVQISEKTHALLLSQDCDIQAEDTVEVVLGEELPENGGLAHGKSNKKLQLKSDTSFITYDVTKRHFITKAAISERSPCKIHVYSLDQRITIRSWVTERYARSSFPDEFSNRLKDCESDLRKTMKHSGDVIYGVFVELNDGEPDTDKPLDDIYDLKLVIVHCERPDPVENSKKANEAVSQIKSIFEKHYKKNNEWKNIRLNGCVAVSEAQFSYALYRKMRKLSLDDLTARNPKAKFPNPIIR